MRSFLGGWNGGGGRDGHGFGTYFGLQIGRSKGRSARCRIRSTDVVVPLHLRGVRTTAGRWDSTHHGSVARGKRLPRDDWRLGRDGCVYGHAVDGLPCHIAGQLRAPKVLSRRTLRSLRRSRRGQCGPFAGRFAGGGERLAGDRERSGIDSFVPWRRGRATRARHRHIGCLYTGRWQAMQAGRATRAGERSLSGPKPIRPCGLLGD